MNRIRGLELLFNLQKSRIRSKADCIIIAIHCMLIEENLLCTGIGEDFDGAEDAMKTELLPDNWNDDQESYSLRYTTRDDQNRLLLKIVSCEHALYVNALVNEDHIYGMNMDVDYYIGDDFGSYESAYQGLDQLITNFKAGILENLIANIPQNNPESSNRLEEFPKSSKTVPNFQPQSTFNAEDNEEFQGANQDNPHSSKHPKVGEQDRQPGGKGQGSMHLNPSSLEEDPTPVKSQGKKGSGTSKRPPGAKYDPISPIKGPDKPNPGHLKPPDDLDGDDTLM